MRPERGALIGRDKAKAAAGNRIALNAGRLELLNKFASNMILFMTYS
jgi:hypothetical protein